MSQTASPAPQGTSARRAFAPLDRDLLASTILTPAHKLTLMALQTFGWKSGICTASNESLAGRAGLGYRTVQEALRRLEFLELIRTEDDPRTPGKRRIHLLWLSQPERIARATGGAPRRSKVRHPAATIRAQMP